MPRAILLDVMMPGVDGWSVLSALKDDAELAGIPVIMVTFVEQRALAASLGAADYVLKPVRWERFKSVMDRYRPSGNGRSCGRRRRGHSKTRQEDFGTGRLVGHRSLKRP